MVVEQAQGDNPDFSAGAEVMLYVGGGSLIQDVPKAVYHRLVLSLYNDDIVPLVLPYWTVYCQASDRAYMADGLADGGNQAVTIAENLTQIPEHAFQGCALQNVTIPETVTHIGDYAFAYCTELTEVNIQGPASIGYEAFEGCSALHHVTVDEGVRDIGGFAFRYTPWLEDQGEFAVLNGVLLNYAGNESEIVLPDQITKIGSQAFASAQINQGLTITQLTIPSQVAAIETDAFAGFHGMTICGAAGSYAETFAAGKRHPLPVQQHPNGIDGRPLSAPSPAKSRSSCEHSDQQAVHEKRVEAEAVMMLRPTCIFQRGGDCRAQHQRNRLLRSILQNMPRIFKNLQRMQIGVFRRLSRLA